MIERYSAGIVSVGGSHPYVTLAEDDRGSFVKYEDHAAEVRGVRTAYDDQCVHVRLLEAQLEAKSRRVETLAKAGEQKSQEILSLEARLDKLQRELNEATLAKTRGTQSFPPLRPVVAAFAAAMESKLLAYGHKGGWRSDTPEALLVRLTQEVDELRVAIRTLAPSEQIEGAAADVANFAMMVADVCKTRSKDTADEREDTEPTPQQIRRAITQMRTPRDAMGWGDFLVSKVANTLRESGHSIPTGHERVSVLFWVSSIRHEMGSTWREAMFRELGGE